MFQYIDLAVWPRFHFRIGTTLAADRQLTDNRSRCWSTLPIADCDWRVTAIGARCFPWS